MPQLIVSEGFQSPADRLWVLLRDFGNLAAWWPRGSPIKIDRVEQEGRGVGMIRHIYYVGVPTPLSERLDDIDDIEVAGDKERGVQKTLRFGFSQVIAGLKAATDGRAHG